MPFVYLDDRIDEHQKVLEAYGIDSWSWGLWVDGLVFCRRNKTAGIIPKAKVPGLLNYRKKAADALVTVGLWERIESGSYLVHDYDEFNHTEARQRRAKAGASARWGESASDA